jgi:serine/threonine protein kinase
MARACCCAQEPTYPSGLSYDAVSFMMQALEKNPQKRLSVAQLLAHPWFDGLRCAHTSSSSSSMNGSSIYCSSSSGHPTNGSSSSSSSSSRALGKRRSSKAAGGGSGSRSS